LSGLASGILAFFLPDIGENGVRTVERQQRLIREQIGLRTAQGFL
jgi:hypothetical protein